MKGGNPRPNTAPTSPSRGLCKIFSSRDNTASLTNLQIKSCSLLKNINFNEILNIKIKDIHRYYIITTLLYVSQLNIIGVSTVKYSTYVEVVVVQLTVKMRRS